MSPHLPFLLLLGYLAIFGLLAARKLLPGPGRLGCALAFLLVYGLSRAFWYEGEALAISWPALAFAFMLLVSHRRSKHSTWLLFPSQALLIACLGLAECIDLALRLDAPLIALGAICTWLLLSSGRLSWYAVSPRQREGAFKLSSNLLGASFFVLLGLILVDAYQLPLTGAWQAARTWGEASIWAGSLWLLAIWPMHGPALDQLDSSQARDFGFGLIFRGLAFFFLAQLLFFGSLKFREISFETLAWLAVVGWLWCHLLSLMQTGLQRLIAYNSVSFLCLSLAMLCFLQEQSPTDVMARLLILALTFYVLGFGYLAWLNQRLLVKVGHSLIISDFHRAGLAKHQLRSQLRKAYSAVTYLSLTLAAITLYHLARSELYLSTLALACAALVVWRCQEKIRCYQL